MKKIAVESGAYNAVICNHWALGGQGAADLANAVIEATNQPSKFQFLYPLEVCENRYWKTLSGLYRSFCYAIPPSLLSAYTINYDRCFTLDRSVIEFLRMSSAENRIISELEHCWQ